MDRTIELLGSGKDATDEELRPFTEHLTGLSKTTSLENLLSWWFKSPVWVGSSVIAGTARLWLDEDPKACFYVFFKEDVPHVVFPDRPDIAGRLTALGIIKYLRRWGKRKAKRDENFFVPECADAQIKGS